MAFRLINIILHTKAFDKELKLITEIAKCNEYEKNVILNIFWGKKGYKLRPV